MTDATLDLVQPTPSPILDFATAKSLGSVSPSHRHLQCWYYDEAALEAQAQAAVAKVERELDAEHKLVVMWRARTDAAEAAVQQPVPPSQAEAK